MPIYGFRCETDASHTEEHYYPYRETDFSRTCETCHGPMVRDLTVEARNHRPSSGFPYITKNISGEPIEVRSIEHERELCKQYGVEKRDDAAWLTKEHMGLDWRTGKPVYHESSGVGDPGCWV